MLADRCSVALVRARKRHELERAINHEALREMPTPARTLEHSKNAATVAAIVAVESGTWVARKARAYREYSATRDRELLLEVRRQRR